MPLVHVHAALEQGARTWASHLSAEAIMSMPSHLSIYLSISSAASSAAQAIPAQREIASLFIFLEDRAMKSLEAAWILAVLDEAANDTGWVDFLQLSCALRSAVSAPRVFPKLPPP